MNREEKIKHRIEILQALRFYFDTYDLYMIWDIDNGIELWLNEDWINVDFCECLDLAAIDKMIAYNAKLLED